MTKLEPRHEEARRMTAKIKIQVGQNALKAAQAALALATIRGPSAGGQGHAIRLRDIALQRRQDGNPARHRDRQAAETQKIKKRAPEVAVSTTPAPALSPPAASPDPAGQPEEALVHYRQGMAAIRKKDFHLALDELDVAYKLDPSNERIYMARERVPAGVERRQQRVSANENILGDLTWKFCFSRLHHLFRRDSGAYSFDEKRAVGMESAWAKSRLITPISRAIAESLQRRRCAASSDDQSARRGPGGDLVVVVDVGRSPVSFRPR